MPEKPTWYSKLDHIIAELEALPFPWVDRSTIEELLGVGRRRAQQILQPCTARQIGSSGVADRGQLIEHLKVLAAGEAAFYEKRRRERLAQTLSGLRREWREQPRLVVEAPTAVLNQEFDDLPAGVEIGPGAVTVRFTTVPEALEKLLALAMAISNDFDRFEKLAVPEE